MQEGQEGVVADGAAGIALARGHPPVWIEVGGVFTPQFHVVVDGPWRENDLCAFGDKFTENGGVVCGVTEGQGNRRPEPQDFLTHGVQIWHVV